MMRHFGFLGTLQAEHFGFAKSLTVGSEAMEPVARSCKTMCDSGNPCAASDPPRYALQPPGRITFVRIVVMSWVNAAIH